MCSAVSRSLASVRATSRTVPPSVPILSAAAWPIPDEAPVIITIRPSTASFRDRANRPPAPGIRCPNARRVRAVVEAIRGRFGGGAIAEATSVRSGRMRVVAATETYPGSVHEAEKVWYDTGLWPRFIDGLESVEEVTPNWPGVGAQVRWHSGPAGRGQVVERVVS